MSEKNERTSSGIGFCGLLTLIFITLKLIGKINWSWLWVLAPLWILPTLSILILTIVAIITIIKSVR